MFKEYISLTLASILIIAASSKAQPLASERIPRYSEFQKAISQQENLTPFIEDFQVNENVGSCSQWNRGIAIDNQGNFVIVWEDERNARMQIFAQRFDQNGQPLAASFLVTESGYDPDIAMNEDGNFVMSWMRPGRRWNPDVYAQRYDSNGNALGESFKVNDDIMDEWPWGYYQQNPTIAIDSGGNFVITWQDWRNSSNGDIYAQRYDASGQPLGVNFQINDDTGDKEQFRPDVAIANNGNFVIAWYDKRNGDYDIYAQHYDSDGNPIGANYRVNDDFGNGLRDNPVIDTDSQGNFVIAWKDSRNGDDDIYAQLYDASGLQAGKNFKVNDDAKNSIQHTPATAMDRNGNFMIIWNDERNEDSDIYAQWYDSTGNALGENLRVNDGSGNSDQQLPTIAANEQGNFVVAWSDERNCKLDIFAQRYSFGGLALGTNFIPNDDIGTSHQIEPAIAVDESGNFVIVWNDLRFEQRGDDYYAREDIYYKGGDVFAQRYNATGQALDANFKVNDDTGCIVQNDPAVAIDEQGRFTIAWEDQRNGNPDIYCRRYTSNGTPQGPSFKVNDDVGTSDQYYPAISVDGHGNFVVVWYDWRNGHYDIFGQRYGSDGTKRGSNFRINDDAGNRDQKFPAIAMHSNGDFVVVWQDERNENPDIYGQRFSSNGARQGTNFLVNDVADSAQSIPAIDVEASGGFVVVWQDERNGHDDICSQRYTSSGSPQGANFRVNDDVGESEQKAPAISADDDGYFVVAWQDYRNGDADIYYQLFDDDGNPVGVNYRVNNDTGASYQGNPDVELVNRFIYFTWEDTRVPVQGYDIFARVDVFDEAPDAPTLLSPANDSSFTVSTQTLTFTVPEDVEGDSLHFRVEVAFDSSFVNQVSGSPFESQNDTTGFSPTPPLAAGSPALRGSYTLQSPLGDGTYYWRVSAADMFGYGEASTIFSFKIGAAPKPDISVLPNPFTPNGDGYNDWVEFKYPEMLTQKPIVRIFNLRGRKVRELKEFSGNEYRWYGRDDDGRDLEPGVYIYILEVEGRKISSGTITLVR